MKPLKELCAEAVVRAVFLLPPDASREAFDEYVGVTWKDGSTFDEWVELMTGMGVYGGESEALDALADVCLAAEPRYPWGDLRDLPRHLLAWEVWCFCVARWVRINDLACIARLPTTWPLDHRHAFAASGPSAARAPDALYAYMEAARGALPHDWLDLLVRPEMWRRAAFVTWATRSRWSARTAARLLTSALQTAARHDNHEAVSVIIDVAERDCDLRDLFWSRVELESAYKTVIRSCLRGLRC